ncbi:MAG: hypothetical protein EBS08_04530 [Cytophagia bacterium]|nr:hypothetical protein [Cytophagia bacterium]
MNSYYGIYFSATSPDFNSNIQVVGNQFSNIYYYYLYLNRMSNLSVTANIFSNASGGFTPYYGFYVLASNGVAFRENQVYGTLNAYGWYFSSINGSASNPNMLVNNVFSCEFTSTTPRALYLTASTTDGLDYLELHHNSFEGRFLSSSTTANGLIYLTGGSATTFFNLKGKEPRLFTAMHQPITTVWLIGEPQPGMTSIPSMEIHFLQASTTSPQVRSLPPEMQVPRVSSPPMLPGI